MTPEVVFRPQAEDEVLEARPWYESRSTGLGQRFATAFDAAIDRIVANPLACQRVYGETRRAVLRKFPYAVYFRIDGAQIVMLAVHSRRDPARWQTRT